MGYRAHHIVTKFSSELDDAKEKLAFEVLADEEASASFFVNAYCLTSAYHPDETVGPYDIIQEWMADKSDNSEDGGDFTLDDKDISDIIEEIRDQFPDHQDTEDAIKELEDVKARDNNCGFYDFECW
jgi:hypothetical protein